MKKLWTKSLCLLLSRNQAIEGERGLEQAGLLLTACVLSFCLLLHGCSKVRIEIISLILRDRVVVTDKVLLRKALYVAYSNPVAPLTRGKPLRIKGILKKNDKILAETGGTDLAGKSGNLVFDLPYQLAAGSYSLQLELADPQHDIFARTTESFNPQKVKATLEPHKAQKKISRWKEVPIPLEHSHYKTTMQDKTRGYVVFSRPFLKYVLPHSRPQPNEVINQLRVRVVRNEYDPITFSIYALRETGKIQVSTTPLKFNDIALPHEALKVAHMETVEDTAGLKDGLYRNIPRIIRPGNIITIDKGESQRFWLTLRIDEDTVPGTYKSEITILPQHGEKTTIPLTVEVLPITLEEVPDVDYFMLMTYEFTELAMPWSKKEKEKIYKAGLNIFKDYKAHGMTTVCIHSPFVFITKADGSPNLDDIFATLRAARDTGFTRPIIWYMGHLIQTAKPKHPGNIVSFEKHRDLGRLKSLVATVTRYSRDNDCPEVIFLPIDEYDDSYQDYQGKRLCITPLLLNTIKKAGAKSMITASRLNPLLPIDYFCSSKLYREDANLAHSKGISYILYNNKVTTDCRNPAYARYIYGWYTWKNNLNGMGSWTFQNTENASGWPTKADAAGRDIYLAYPDPASPLSTPEWEAVREGVDDRKLFYQLEKRLTALNKMDIDTSAYTSFLEKDKGAIFEPDWRFDGSFRNHDRIDFKKIRGKLLSLILEIDTKFLVN